MHGLFRNLARLALVSVLAPLMAGCVAVVGTEGVSANPAMAQYRQLAFVGLSDESEAVFTTMFMEAFPTMAFVEKDALLRLAPEEDLLSGRLGSDVRSNVRSTLGVEGIVAILWEDSGGAGSMEWSLTITDTDTGEVTGSAIARLRKEPLARGVPFADLERRAFEVLISALKEELGG